MIQRLPDEALGIVLRHITLDPGFETGRDESIRDFDVQMGSVIRKMKDGHVNLL